MFKLLLISILSFSAIAYESSLEQVREALTRDTLDCKVFDNNGDEIEMGDYKPLKINLPAEGIFDYHQEEDLYSFTTYNKIVKKGNIETRTSQNYVLSVVLVDDGLATMQRVSGLSIISIKETFKDHGDGYRTIENLSGSTTNCFFNN